MRMNPIKTIQVASLNHISLCILQKIATNISRAPIELREIVTNNFQITQHQIQQFDVESPK